MTTPSQGADYYIFFSRTTGSKSVGTYSTSDFRKGLKVQIDGIPYLMIEMNFRKPGKGNALYECKLRNLLRGTVTDKTYRAGQTLESADVSEFNAQFLYRQGEEFVFMKNDDYEQYEMSAESVGDAWKYLKDNMDCQLVVYNNLAIAVTPPNHVVLKVEYCEPGAKGNTATNVTKPCKLADIEGLLLRIVEKKKLSNHAAALQTRDQMQHRRLARARWTEQCNDPLSAREGDGEIERGPRQCYVD